MIAERSKDPNIHKIHLGITLINEVAQNEELGNTSFSPSTTFNVRPASTAPSVQLPRLSIHNSFIQQICGGIMDFNEPFLRHQLPSFPVFILFPM